MSLVEAYQREKIARRQRFARAAQRYLEEKSKPKPAPIVHRITPLRRPYDAAEELAWRVSVEGFVPEYDAKVPTIAEIRQAVCDHFGVDLTALLSARRTAVLILPRQLTYYLCVKLTTKSLPEIGRHLGGRNHATILHGVRKVARMVETDDRVQASIEMLTHRMGAKDISDKRPVAVKLTTDIARAIFYSREHPNVVGRKYGISACSVRNIRARRTWRSI